MGHSEFNGSELLRTHGIKAPADGALRLCTPCEWALYGLGGNPHQDHDIRGAGDECAACGYSPRDAHQMAQSAIFDIVGRARAAGASGTEIRQLFDSVLNDLDHAHAVALDSRPPLDGDTWPTAW